MKTYLLLAGRSTRFWPLTEKTLFPICGKTLLEHQIERLRTAGCADITLVGGAHNLEAATGITTGLPVIEQEQLELGMRGAVLSILKHHNMQEPLFIVSGNDVVEPRAYASMIKSGGDGALLAKRTERYFPGGYLSVDGSRITGIVEKPGEGNEPSDLINLVAHVHRRPAELLNALEAESGEADGAYERAMQSLFASYEYEAVAYDGHWQAVKYPWHLLPLTQMLLEEITEQRIHPSVNVHPTAVIEGNVILEEGVRVFPHATVRGPAYIGKRSIVANNALVRNSSVGEDCVVGYSTEVKGSVLRKDVWTHMNYVGDSVIGQNVSFGGGTMTGNFRLDEAEVLSVVSGERVPTGLEKFGCIIGDDCRIGVQVAMNPGIKIGGNSQIATKALIMDDVPQNSFVIVKDGAQEIRENTRAVQRAESRLEIRKKL